MERGSTTCAERGGGWSWALVLAAVLGLAELPFAAFMADDLMHLSILEGVSPCTWLGPFELYTLSDGVPEHVRIMQDAGAFPWFLGPRFKMAFFRPLTSATIALDHALWGLWPAGYRVQGTIWFMALVGGFGLVLRRVLPGRVGTLALLLFAVSAIHASLFWNATRHIVVAGALGMLGLAAHVQWREAGWRPGRAVSLMGFALAFSASEAALAMMVYPLAYEALGAPGDAKERSRSVAPLLILIVVYAVVLLGRGLGTSNGAGYLDPLQAPLAFLRELPGRWLFMGGALLAGGNADLWILRPDLRGVLVPIGGALVVGMVAMLRVVWPSAAAGERRGARWLIAAAAVSIVPFTGTPIGSRCLVLPLIGGSVAIALVLERWWSALRRRPGMTSRLVGAGAILLAVIHGLAPLGRLTGPYVLREMLHERLATVMDQVELDPARLASQDVVVLRAPDFIVGLHSFFFRRLYRMPMARSWRTLSWAPSPHRLTRTAADAFELEIPAADIEAPRLEVGDEVVLDGMRAHVLAHGGEGPSRVRFRFDRPLDDDTLWFLGWRDGRLQRVVPPPIGQEIVL